VTIYISIGNSDDKLTQSKWQDYVVAMDNLVDYYIAHTHGRWFSAPDTPYQNACWCIEVDERDLDAIRCELALLAQRFGQDSIALAVVTETEFIEPSPEVLG